MMTNICANCGKEGSDVTNTCNKCKPVMYCNAACKKKHRHKHKKACERRVAELRDEKLFRQPKKEEDCLICFLRLPALTSGRAYMACCGKTICGGCIYAVHSRAKRKKDRKCPFCRTPPPSSDEEEIKRLEKRMELNDANAIYNMGCHYAKGLKGIPQNYYKALGLYHRAGELGYANAYYNIAHMYRQGRGVEVDENKETHYYELAAMEGDAKARHNLGCIEARKGNMNRALKHWMIAVRDRDSHSLESIKSLYSIGIATKDDYASALRSFQAYLDEVKSDQRDEAAAENDSIYYDSAR